MWRWAMLFLVLAIVAGAFGLSSVETEPAPMMRAVVLSLLGVGLGLLVLHVVRRDR
ncbi:MAG TPA: hypothetical protein VIP05_29965 [Burkholderiaceae bacterium]